jgi:hypothetical protein
MIIQEASSWNTSTPNIRVVKPESDSPVGWRGSMTKAASCRQAEMLVRNGCEIMAICDQAAADPEASETIGGVPVAE